MAVVVGLLAFAFGALGPAVQPVSADSWVWPTTGRITQRYGCTGFSWERPYGSCRHFHRGIDIANSAGTRIRAASAGVVTFVGYNPYDAPGDRAWIVTIKHDNGVTGWYAHMQAKRVDGARAGDRVSAGQLIGYMGSTGRSTGVHLHFGLQRNGAPVNPMLYLDGKPSGATTRSRGTTTTAKEPTAEKLAEEPTADPPRRMALRNTRYPLAV
jgi:murein DD-endopeptidase MepM/ murein hydrolase activator NlpD